MAQPLIVNVVELLRWPGTSKDVAMSIAMDDFEFEDSRIIDVPVDVAVRLESFSNSVEARGTAVVTWAGECRRCLAPLEEKLTVDFDEIYERDPEDREAFTIVNDQINLLPMVRENILLAIPLGPLCREDCPGFCPHCGRDLSEGECNCDNTVTDARWSALDNLKGALPDTDL